MCSETLGSLREAPVADLMSILKQAGFKGDGLKMAYAIAMAESGGNAKAHNGNAGTGDNSYGLFQINMLGSMGPSRLKQYGLASNNSLFDALTNAKVAYKMSHGGTSWGPWSTYGNGAYKKYYGGTNANVTNNVSGNSSSDSGSSSPDPLSKGELAETYGFVDTLFDSVPELKTLFAKAVKGQWTASKFQASLRDTKWWKTKSDTARQFLMLQYGDPATAKQKLSQALVTVKQLSNQLGVRGGSDMAKQLNTWALHMVMDGWDESRLRYDMGKWISFGGDIRSGEGGEALDKLKEYAYNMGVTMDSKWYADAGRAIVRGTGAQQDYEDRIRRQSKTVYSQWGKEIDGGQTVADIAAPYFSSMAQILELPSGSINLFDPVIKKALQNKDKITGANTVKPLWQFENELRSDNRWKGTQNAQNSMMQVAHQVLADFGVKS